MNNLHLPVKLLSLVLVLTGVECSVTGEQCLVWPGLRCQSSLVTSPEHTQGHGDMTMRTTMMMMMLVMMMIVSVESKCKIHHLGVKQWMRSETILSGTVMSFYMRQSGGGAQAGKIKIRRVFKGDQSLEGRLVIVQGFGDSDICLSNPRLGDTKLFFLSESGARSGQHVFRFTLNDNILKINMRNLKTLIKLRERRKRMILKKTRPLSSTTPSSLLCESAVHDCMREPRALQMLNDDTRHVTPVSLPLLPSPTVTSSPSLFPPPVVSSPPSLCSFSPCEEGGSCEEHDHTFTCHCTPGRAGRYCEISEDTRNTEAGFTGDSFISLYPDISSVTRTSLELSFRSFSEQGIILLWLGHTDWMSVAVVRGYVEVRYELGSGVSVMVSSSPVVLGQWHRLVFRRYHRDGMMQLDQGEVVKTRGRGRNKSLNIKDKLYIGGHPYSNTSQHLVGTDRGLQGCVRDVRMMRRDVGLLESVVRRQEVIQCDQHPCREGFCANNGQCEARQSRGGLKPSCSCDRHWRGRRCMKKKKRKKKKKHRSRDSRYYNETYKDYYNNKRRHRKYQRQRY